MHRKGNEEEAWKPHREGMMCLSDGGGRYWKPLERFVRHISFHAWEGRFCKQTTRRWMGSGETEGAGSAYARSGNRLILRDVCLGYFNVRLQYPWLGSSLCSWEHSLTPRCLDETELLCWRNITRRVVQNLSL